MTGAVRHPLFARLYDRMSRAIQAEVAEYRERLLAGLSGAVVEIGAGNGLNFPHYPPAVTCVLAVEPEPYLRECARARARAAPVPVQVVDSTAETLPVAGASHDAAVTSLVLCSVADPARALAEAYRVVRPGGQLRFFEHVLAEDPRLARAQRAVDVVWPRLAGGCHAGRDTLAAIRRAGFDVETVERFRFPATRIPLPTSPHVLGCARRP
jgi:ubiquinone/menaquinone biosynthesis C-methylase UbiE